MQSSRTASHAGGTISVVIPAHNEADGLATTVDRIREVLTEHAIVHEVIVVDDGSSDETYAAIRRLASEDPNLKGVRLSRNFGKESALLAGLRTAAGDAVVTMDADLQHPPALLPKLYDHWRAGAKVVHAIKRTRATDSLATRWRARAFNTLMSRLGGIDLRHASDFKLLDRVVVDILVGDLRERRRFYRGLTDWVGLEQARVPFDVEARDTGRGKWSLFSLVEMATTALVSFTSAPLRIVTVLGVITLVFALGVATETIISWFRGTAVSGFATLEITILLIGSFIMISLGIVGEYIAKIYDEAKGRPVYVVSSTCGFDEGSPETAPDEGRVPRTEEDASEARA